MNGEEAYQSTSYKSALINGNFIEIPLFSGAENVLRLKDGKTGKILWTWDHPSISGGDAISDLKVYNQYIILNNWTSIVVIDGITGETVWFSDHGAQAGNRIKILEGYIYHTIYDKHIDHDTSFFTRSPVETMNWDTLYKIQKDDPLHNGGESSISGPIRYNSTEGKSYLISNIGSYNLSNNQAIGFLRAFNEETKAFDWISTEEGGYPFLHRNKIYCLRDNYIKCFNPENGNLIWKQRISNQAGEGVFREHSITFHENYVIIKTMGELFMAFDTETGDKLWENTFKSHGPIGGLHVYQDKVYFMGTGYERIQGARITTGELFMDWKSPNRDEFSNASFSWSGVDIDTESGYLYVSDKYYTMCLDLNKIED